MDERGVSIALTGWIRMASVVQRTVRRRPVEHRHEDGGLAHHGVLAAAGRGSAGLHQELRVALHRLNLEGEGRDKRFQGAGGGVMDARGLTQEGREAVAQGETLVTRNAEGGKRVEPLVQERLQAGS